MRSGARAVVPLALRQELAAARRVLRDWRSGFRPTRARGAPSWPSRIEVTQQVRTSTDPTLHAAKLANLQRGAAALDGSLIPAGSVWSFWALIGRPSESRGYAAGRSLVDGRLVRESGGGLCQMSGLLYHLALLSGLDVLERHPHSIDLYREEERVTPLGADATVVWGYKDLRLRNPHAGPVLLRVAIEGLLVRASLTCAFALEPLPLRFHRRDLDRERAEVTTLRGAQIVDVSTYIRKPGLRIGA